MRVNQRNDLNTSERLSLMSTRGVKCELDLQIGKVFEERTKKNQCQFLGLK